MRTLFTFFLTFLSVSLALSNPIDKQQARQLASQFMQSHGAIIQGEPMRAPGKKTSPQSPLYIFNTENNKGFVIVAGNDLVDPILGYTEQGYYNEEEMPENFRAWLDMYTKVIEALEKDDREMENRPMKEERHEAVAPLIKTEWGQRHPYNALCPTDDGIHCPTGCVATAGAQIMYYYKWPKEATKSVPANYTIGDVFPENQEDLPPITFRWDDMKLQYHGNEGTASEMAVAELMQYCGYAAGTSYISWGAESHPYSLAKGMVKYFDYDPFSWHYIYHSTCTNIEWDEMMYKELKEGRPIIYSGSALNLSNMLIESHAFICDGYDGNGFYHFNWGWGSPGGYFKLYLPNPNGNTPSNSGYIYDMSAVIGLQPNKGITPEEQGQYEEWEDETVAIKAFDMGAGNGNYTTIGFNFLYLDNTTDSFSIGLGELNADGTISMLETHFNSIEFYPNSALFDGLSYYCDEYNLSKGVHRLIPIYLREGESKWRRCKPYNKYFKVTVDNDDKIYAEVVYEGSFNASDFKVISGCHPQQHQIVSLTLTNEGEDFDGDLFLLVDADNGVDNNPSSTANKSKSYNNQSYDDWEYVGTSPLPIKIKAGGTKTYRVPTSRYGEGSYTLRLCLDEGGNNVLATTKMEIQQKLKVTKIDVPTDCLKGYIQEVHVTVENTGGDYNLPLYLFASKTDEANRPITIQGTAIDANSSEEVTFYFLPSEEGVYNLWVTTDWEGNCIIGKSTVNIEEWYLKASDLNVTGTKLASFNQTVEVTFNNIKRDIETNLFLFASKTTVKPSDRPENVKASAQGDMVGIAYNVLLKAGETTSLTFGFIPMEEGEWNLWVTTDWEGNEVVAQGIVEIQSLKTTLSVVNGLKKAYIRQTMELTISNPIQDLETNLNFLAHKADDIYVHGLGSENDVLLKSGETTTFTFEFLPYEAGMWDVWVTMDDGSIVIAQTTVEIGEPLKATQMEVTGLKMAYVKQPVEVTFYNPEQDFETDLCLFASKTDEKGYWRSYKRNVLLRGGESTTVTLDFIPDEEGEWNLWVTMDMYGNCVVGQGKVTIDNPQMGEVTLSLEDCRVIVEGGTATLTMKVKNIGNTTNYKEITIDLSELGEDDFYHNISTQEIPPNIIEPGETKDFTIIFEGIEQGKKYSIWTHYYGLVTDGYGWNTLGYLQFDSSNDSSNINKIVSNTYEDSWYTLDGRKLTMKPTRKGIYINNGRKVVIK